MKQSIEEAAKQYAENNQYGLEEHDEGGYIGINTNEFSKHLVKFHLSQIADASKEEPKGLANGINLFLKANNNHAS